MASNSKTTAVINKYYYAPFFWDTLYKGIRTFMHETRQVRLMNVIFSVFKVPHFSPVSPICPMPIPKLCKYRCVFRVDTRTPEGAHAVCELN